MKISVHHLALVAAAAPALPAHAMLVLQGPEDFQRTGLGSVGRAPGDDADVITGDAMAGASQTLTRSIDSLGITSASDLRVVFNALEPGNGLDNITLTDLRLSIFSPTGEVLFNSGALTSPLAFADSFTGAGNSGFVFALDAAQAAAAQALAFSANFGSNLIGLYASVADATRGPETFFVASAGGDVTPPIPESRRPVR